MTDAPPRQPGYYPVRLGAAPVLLQWDGLHWFRSVFEDPISPRDITWIGAKQEMSFGPQQRAD